MAQQRLQQRNSHIKHHQCLIYSTIFCTPVVTALNAERKFISMMQNFIINYVSHVISAIPLTLVFIVGICFAAKRISINRQKSVICIWVFAISIIMLYVPQALRTYFVVNRNYGGSDELVLLGHTIVNIVHMFINVGLWSVLIYVLFARKYALNEHS